MPVAKTFSNRLICERFGQTEPGWPTDTKPNFPFNWRIKQSENFEIREKNISAEKTTLPLPY